MSSESIQSVAYDYDDFQLHIFTNFHFTILRMTKLTKG